MPKFKTKHPFYLNRQKGFTPIQIIFFILAAGIIVGGASFFLKPSLELPQDKCGDEVCGPLEKLDKNLCPKDCAAVQTDGFASNIPYYFIAIHNEPFHGFPNQTQMIVERYEKLKEMVAKADEYHIKLTLMFTAPWADYIAESSERMAELEEWKKEGHEIAGHHHGLYHGNWDGYTDYSEEEAKTIRKSQGKEPEKYLGILSDYIKELKKINPDIRSGCMNDDADKKDLPDEIIYDTCSGFANHGEAGVREADWSGPENGQNKYLTVGVYKNIERKWLKHNPVTTAERANDAEEIFISMDPVKVYGAVTHSNPEDLDGFYSFLDFAHSKDQKGAKSRTMSEIIEQSLLPEKRISDELINTVYGAKKEGVNAGAGKCGDGICGPIEKLDSNLCPADCKGPETQEKCEVNKEYAHTASNPITCVCPEGYEFEVVSISWGPCAIPGKTDCPALLEKCAIKTF
ncbi:hypothetical protein HY798_03290 [Candidatus Falkowbacteria bacterium]|nr:hypothetical protein [Candidatus Falkowbacteria bacterium]